MLKILEASYWCLLYKGLLTQGLISFPGVAHAQECWFVIPLLSQFSWLSSRTETKWESRLPWSTTQTHTLKLRGSCHPLPAESFSRMNKAASWNHEEQVFASIVAEEEKTNEQACNITRYSHHSESSIFPCPYPTLLCSRNFSVDSLWNIFLLGWKERHIVSLKTNKTVLFILFLYNELTADLGIFLLLHKSR